MKHKVLLTLRIAGWLILTFVTLEVCARTEDTIRNGAPFFGNYNIDTLYVKTPQGKFGRPNTSYLKWHLNEVGFRGPALRGGTYRIVCIGSSETFGLYESPEHEWPRQLETMLNESVPGRPYEVVDTAYPGLSIATTLNRLPLTISTLHPKAAVIYPSYTSYIETSLPVSTPSITRIPTPSPSPAHFEWRIAGRFDTLSKSVLPEVIQHKMRSWQIQRDIRGKMVMDRLPEQNVQAFQTDLDSLTTQLVANGVQVILVTHANRFGPVLDPADRSVLTDWRKFYPTLTEDGLLDMEQRMSVAVRRVGMKHEIPVVDAATLIAPGKGDFAEFVHFTDAGAAALASAVSGEIKHDAASGTRLARLDS